MKPGGFAGRLVDVVKSKVTKKTKVTKAAKASVPRARARVGATKAMKPTQAARSPQAKAAPAGKARARRAAAGSTSAAVSGRGAEAPTAAAVRHARALLATIERRLARIVEDFYEVGTALRELQRGRGYQALGYGSFRAMIDDTGLMSTTQAFKLMAVADAMSRDHALALGPERAYAVARLVAATDEPDSVPLLFERGVPVDPEDDDSERVPLAELPLAAIESLTKTVLATRGRPHADEEAVSVGRDAHAAVRTAGVRRASVSCAESSGEWWATVRLPLAELEAWAGRTRKTR